MKKTMSFLTFAISATMTILVIQITLIYASQIVTMILKLKKKIPKTVSDFYDQFKSKINR